MGFDLTGSVGQGGANSPADVVLVQQRLIDLGFTFIGAANGVVGAKMIRAIQLFQSIKAGKNVLGGDGRVDKDGNTHQWLNAANAPKWITMPASGDGFVNIEVADPNDKHDFGTNWLSDTLSAAAKKYKDDYLATHTANLLTINDASLPEGGDTPDHQGHETGLACDLRLPVKNTTGASPGGTTINSANFDRDAARAIIQAFRAQPLADLDGIFNNDQTLINEGLCKALAGHDNHIHVQIKPPTLQP